MRRFLIASLLALAAHPAVAQRHLGDFSKHETVYCHWATFDTAGASVTRATDGVVSVYEDGGTTEITAGVTDTEDFDAETGHHLAAIDLTNAAYESGKDYTIDIDGAVVDGNTINAPLCSFSVNRNLWARIVHQDTLQSATASILTLATGASATDGTYDNQLVCVVEGTGLDQGCRFASGPPDGTAYNGTSKALTLRNAFVTTLDSTSVVQIIDIRTTTVDTPANFGDLDIEAGTGYVSADCKEIETVDATDQIVTFTETGTNDYFDNTGAFSVVEPLWWSTASANGTTTTLVSSGLSAYADDYWNGAEIRFSNFAESNYGQWACVTDWVNSTTTLTFQPAVPTATVSGEDFQLFWNTGCETMVQTDGITALSIATDAIDADAIATNSITSAELGTAAIAAANIATDAISVTKIAAQAITADKIAADAIGASELAADAIGASELAAGAIDEIFDEIIETAGTTYTARCILAAALAVLAGQTSDFEAFQDPGGSTTRVAAASFTAGSDRSSITITCP